jgi:hypothetical protein
LTQADYATAKLGFTDNSVGQQLREAQILVGKSDANGPARTLEHS